MGSTAYLGFPLIFSGKTNTEIRCWGLLPSGWSPAGGLVYDNPVDTWKGMVLDYAWESAPGTKSGGCWWVGTSAWNLSLARVE